MGARVIIMMGPMINDMRTILERNECCRERLEGLSC